MYHRGGDQGWHQRPPRDMYPTRNHQPTPYRGGYHDHREHNNYGQYDHNACHNRNYNGSQFMEYEEPTYQNYHEENRPYQEENRPYHEENRPYQEENRPYHEENRPYQEENRPYHEAKRPYQEENRPYHEENRPYHGYRNPRDQAHHMRGHSDRGHQKDFRGDYNHNHEESSRYHLSKSQRKKYPYKSVKPHSKERDPRLKTSTAKSVESVVQNPVQSVTSSGSTTQNPSESKIVPSQDKNLAEEIAKPAQQDAKAVPEGTIVEDNKKTTQNETISVQNSAKATDDEVKPEQVSTEPLIEDTKRFRADRKPSEKSIQPLDKGAKAAKVVVKEEPIETEINTYIGEPVCDTKQGTMTTQLSCKIECLEDTQKDIQTPSAVEEKENFCTTGDKLEETIFDKWHSETQDKLSTNDIEIPLLGTWADTPSSDSKEAAGTSTKIKTEPFVDPGISNTEKELRRAFILAKKEEIELAFSQDCRTFAFVANTLLKKDPSLEVAVSNALRSTLQDIAGRCVQELSKFIDHYDSIPVSISERLENSDI